MGKPGVSVSVDISSLQRALPKIAAAVEREVIDALDAGAASVQDEARSGHPKVADRIQGKEAMPYRQRTPETAGIWAGHLRYLTRTSNLNTSIKVDPAKKITGGYESSVFSAIEYADRIEEIFPFIRPALETKRGEITRRVKAAVQRGLRG